MKHSKDSVQLSFADSETMTRIARQTTARRSKNYPHRRTQGLSKNFLAKKKKTLATSHSETFDDNKHYHRRLTIPAS